MRKKYLLLLAILGFHLCLWGQELDAKVTINTSKIQSVDKQAITELESAIKQMLNEQTWSNAKFDKNERIDCTIGITLNTMPSENTYGAEIHITARRPVYSSAYITPTINYRDTKFDFNYMMGQSLDYNQVNLSNNIVGVIAFYVNIVLGLDFDSFALGAGQTYFAQAMDIANKAQPLNTRGWEPFDGKSRYDLALALTEDNAKHFHSLWYNYHRLGLDEMSGNASRGRLRILGTLADLEAIHTARPNSILLPFFAETKLDEFVKVCTKATAEEKKDAKERLKKLFPTKRALIDSMN